MNFNQIFPKGSNVVIGMVHCLPLPGMPAFGGSMDAIIRQAVLDAQTLEREGCDAVIVENMGDSPFGIRLDVAQSTALAIVAHEVRKAIRIPVGIDAAMNDYECNFAIAKAVGAAFVRIPVFVDTVEFYGGVIKPVAREAVQYRQALGCEDVAIFADIQVKHTNMLIPNVSIEYSARAAQDCGADAVIVTGSAIGVETPIEIIKRAKKVIKLPLIVASGVNPQNIKEQLNIAEAAIIGSGLKEDGILSNPISAKKCKEIFNALR